MVCDRPGAGARAASHSMRAFTYGLSCKLDLSHTTPYVTQMRSNKIRPRGPSKPLKADPSHEASARERAKAETRAALIEAGVALIAEQGLDVPSLDAICDRAGYTR